MKRIVFNLIIGLSTFTLALCAASFWHANKHTVSTEIPQSPSRQQQTPGAIAEPEIFDDFVDEPTLKYAGYEASTRNKQVKIEGINALANVTYAVITRDRKAVDTFDGLEGDYHPMGNDTRFGLFPFLGRESKQLIIEQTQWRGWAYFIVDFSPYRIVFDSARWGVGRELMYQDVDGDGVFEISQAVLSFAFFETLMTQATATSHLVDITFKYDRATHRYLPANHIFQSESLAGIESQIETLDRKNERQFASGVLKILLTYIYAGQEKEAWVFYDREYTHPNKEVLEEKIKVVLESELVYRFIYRKE